MQRSVVGTAEAARLAEAKMGPVAEELQNPGFVAGDVVP